MPLLTPQKPAQTSEGSPKNTMWLWRFDTDSEGNLLGVTFRRAKELASYSVQFSEGRVALRWASMRRRAFFTIYARKKNLSHDLSFARLSSSRDEERGDSHVC